MSWGPTVLTGLACGMDAGVCGLFIAARCVDWYRISSREGKSGYFIAAITIGSGLAGLVLGGVAARVAVANGHGLWWEQLSAGVVAVGVLVTIAACWARLAADVPPLMDGKEIEIEVELRWPETQTSRPGWNREEARLRIGSIHKASRVMRAEQLGTFDNAGPRFQDGRWIIGGTLPLFTSRGERVMRIKLGDIQEGFGLPIPAKPKADLCEWSDWLPRARTDGQPPMNKMMYRFRIAPAKN